MTTYDNARRNEHGRIHMLPHPGPQVAYLQQPQPPQPTTSLPNAKRLKFIACLQIFIAFGVIVAEIVFIAHRDYNLAYVIVSDDIYFTPGTGFWLGVIIIAAAVLGFFSSIKKKKCLVISCLVLTVIMSVTALGAILCYLAELVYAQDSRQMYRLHECNSCYTIARVKGFLGIAAAVVTLVSGVIQTVFCCRAVCSCCASKKPVSDFGVGGQVHAPAPAPAPAPYNQNTYAAPPYPYGAPQVQQAPNYAGAVFSDIPSSYNYSNPNMESNYPTNVETDVSAALHR